MGPRAARALSLPAQQSWRTTFAMRLLFVLAFSVAAAAACAPAPKPVDGVFPLKVGPGGGVVRGESDAGTAGLVLEIPAGALDAEVELDATLTVDLTPLASETSTFVGQMFALLPDGATFKKPVKLTVPLEPHLTADFDQTAADCRVWVRDGDGWRQNPAVGNTEDTVTIELEKLATAGAGVNFAVSRTGLTPGLPCVDPSGFCVDLLTELLRPSSVKETISEVTNNKFYYQVFASSASASVVEFDLSTGMNARESRVLNPPVPMGLPYEQAIVYGDDDSVYASMPGVGMVKFPFAGLPTVGPSKAGVDQVRRSDGTIMSATLSTVVSSSGADFFDMFLNGVRVVNDNPEGRVRLAAHPTDRSIIGLFGTRVPLILAAGSTTPSEFSIVPTAAFDPNNDEFALSADGSKIAYSFNGTSPELRFANRSAETRRITTLPALLDMAFSTDDLLYSISGARPEVFQTDATGQTLVIDLSKSGVSDTALLPRAIRRLPSRAMLVVTNSGRVMRIRPSL